MMISLKDFEVVGMVHLP